MNFVVSVAYDSDEFTPLGLYFANEFCPPMRMEWYIQRDIHEQKGGEERKLTCAGKQRNPCTRCPMLCAKHRSWYPCIELEEKWDSTFEVYLWREKQQK